MMLPGSVAIVNAAFSASERGRALGTMGGVAAVAGALGPTIGGVLTALSWRLVLLVNVAPAQTTAARGALVPGAGAQDSTRLGPSGDATPRCRSIACRPPAGAVPDRSPETPSMPDVTGALEPGHAGEGAQKTMTGHVVVAVQHALEPVHASIWVSGRN
jgi:MFS family permease